MSDIKTKFTLHTEYKDFVPGVTNIQFGTLSPLEDATSFGMSVVLFIASVFATVFLAGGAISEFTTEVLFQFDGYPMTVQVVGCQMAGRSPHRPGFNYSYTVNGPTYTGYDIVKYSDTNTKPMSCKYYPDGTPVQALYVGSAPYRSQLIWDRGIGYLLYTIVISLGLLVLAALAIVGAVYVARRVYRYGRAKQIQPRLSAKAIILEGEIIHIDSDFRNKSTQLYVIVHYRFETPRKKSITGYAEAHRQDLIGTSLPPVGTPVAVLYADDSAHMVL